METYVESLRAWVVGYGPRVLAAAVIFFAGLTAAKLTSRALRRGLVRAEFDETLGVFLSRLAYLMVLAFAVIVTIQKLGVDTTSFAAVIAAMGLAIGLALQGSLSNFASGVMLIAFRPFKVGDLVEVGGAVGTVSAIAVFATELMTPDNRRVFVPNAAITSGTIVNHTAEDKRRIDLVIGIEYANDPRKAKRVLEEVLAAEPRVLKAPASVVAVSALTETAVNLVVRTWVKSGVYEAVKFDLFEQIKPRFDEEGITFSIPRRDLRGPETTERRPA